MGDLVPPSQVIGAPGSYAVVSSPVTLSGTATDDVAVGEVRVEIYDRVTMEWWSDTGWQPVRSFVLADVTQPVPGDATWEYEFDLDGLTPSSACVLVDGDSV